jgi:hypothetical protein
MSWYAESGIEQNEHQIEIIINLSTIVMRIGVLMVIERMFALALL